MQQRRKVIPVNRKWATSEKTRPLPIIGDSNVVNGWAFFDCDHAGARCAERGSEYDADDLRVIVALDLAAVFTSPLADTPVFKQEFRPIRRAQIRDCCNRTISAIVDIDAYNQEVFLVTILTPIGDKKVSVKEHNLLTITSTSPASETAKLVLSKYGGAESIILASCWVENTAWL